MRVWSNLVLGAVLCVLVGCSSWNRADVGTVGGAAAGGLAGHALTGGSLLGTVGGAAGGAYLGNRIGNSMDNK